MTKARAKLRTRTATRGRFEDPILDIVFEVYRRAISDAGSKIWLLSTPALSWLDSREARDLALVLGFTYPNRQSLALWAAARREKNKKAEDEKACTRSRKAEVARG